jgi:hypothetical protein
MSFKYLELLLCITANSNVPDCCKGMHNYAICCRPILYEGLISFSDLLCLSVGSFK